MTTRIRIKNDGPHTVRVVPLDKAPDGTWHTLHPANSSVMLAGTEGIFYVHSGRMLQIVESDDQS